MGDEFGKPHQITAHFDSFTYRMKLDSVLLLLASNTVDNGTKTKLNQHGYNATN